MHFRVDRRIILILLLLSKNLNADTFVSTSSPSTPGAAPTDVCTIIGSATKVIRVLKVSVNANQTTGGLNHWLLIKRSTADTGGTSTATTIFPINSASPAATAVTRSYTANPSLGNTIGTINLLSYFNPTLLSVLSTAQFSWDLSFGYFAQGVILNGTTEQLSVNLNGVTLPLGLSVSCSMFWNEE